MKAIVDTNVVHSGVFYGGLPGRVPEAWRDKRFTLVLSAPILAEYRATGAEFEANYGGADFEAFGLSMTPFALHLASLTTLRDSRRCKPGGPPKIRCVQPRCAETDPVARHAPYAR